jgi:hypothetical protein
LFSPEIDILSRLLLPLAGPEELDADEMDKLPDDLQYLPPDKQREEDADIRTMIIEALMMVDIYTLIITIDILVLIFS